jgi:hypothetical protein
MPGFTAKRARSLANKVRFTTTVSRKKASYLATGRSTDASLGAIKSRSRTNIQNRG